MRHMLPLPICTALVPARSPQLSPWPPRRSLARCKPNMLLCALFDCRVHLRIANHHQKSIQIPPLPFADQSDSLPFDRLLAAATAAAAPPGLALARPQPAHGNERWGKTNRFYFSPLIVLRLLPDRYLHLHLHFSSYFFRCFAACSGTAERLVPLSPLFPWHHPLRYDYYYT